jgi:hypothetical protein
MRSELNECALGVDVNGDSLRILFLLERSHECQQRVVGFKSRYGLASSHCAAISDK